MYTYIHVVQVALTWIIDGQLLPGDEIRHGLSSLCLVLDDNSYQDECRIKVSFIITIIMTFYSGLLLYNTALIYNNFHYNKIFGAVPNFTFSLYCIIYFVTLI